MKQSVLVFILGLIFLLAGCAAGNKYDYRLDRLPLPVEGQAAVGVSVKDDRPYVLNGDKKPTFVGLQRGGYGNPFDVHTESGDPLADDMEDSLARGLAARGFEVTRLDLSGDDGSAIAVVAQRDGLDRVVLLDVLEWKSDAMMKLSLHYDLRLKVFDADGKLLAESAVAGVKAVGGAKFESQNARSVATQLERRLGDLFADPTIEQAL